MTASLGGRDRIVHLFLDKEADINTRSSFRGNAIRVASAGGHEKVLRLLLERGAGTYVMTASKKRPQNGVVKSWCSCYWTGARTLLAAQY